MKVLILLLLQIVSYETQEHLDGPLGHWAAINFCKSKGYSGISAGVNKASHEKLKSLLRAFQASTGDYESSMWIGLRRHKFVHLTWINGTATDSRNFNVYEDNPMCGYLDLSGDSIYTTDCRNKLRYLCQSKDCAAFRRDTCVCTKGTCHRIGIGYSDWYSARKSCLLNDEDLATKLDKDIINALSALVLAGQNHISEREKMDTYSFWIGSRSMDWLVPGAKKGIFQYYWLPDEPDPKLDCVVLTSTTGEYGWRSRDCEEKEFFVCDSKVGYKNATKSSVLALGSDQKLLVSHPVSEGVGNESTTMNQLIFLPSSLVLWSVLISIISFIGLLFTISVWKAKKKKDNPKQNSKNKENKRAYLSGGKTPRQRILTGNQSTQTTGSTENLLSEHNKVPCESKVEVSHRKER